MDAMSYDAYMEHGYGIDISETPYKNFFLEDLYNMVAADVPALLDGFNGFEDFDENAFEYTSIYGDNYGIEALLADYLNEKFFPGYQFFKYEGGCLYVPDYMPSRTAAFNPTKEDVEEKLRTINKLFSSPLSIQPLTVWIS